MSGGFNRRDLIVAAGASLCAWPAFAADELAAIEARVGGRLGVAALHAASGAQLTHRADERFPMCSTFKAMAIAAALAKVDAGHERLDRFVRYGKADLFEYAPVTRANVGNGGMALGELCAAAIELSDNTAANLVLKSIGGPAGWTRFVGSLGDSVSRLDRTETELNTSIPGDPRDTTTPAAMAADLGAVLLGPTPLEWLQRRQRDSVGLRVLGPVLSHASTAQLTGWMRACKTGDARLRAGLPRDWQVADKTGTGDHGTANDIAVVSAPHGSIVIACYLTAAEAAKPDARDAAIADVGRLVAATFRPATRRG